PVAGLPSLSRLMKDGIGKGMTREDHANVSSQLFASYSKVKSIRNLAAIIGEEELSPLDKLYLKFGNEMEEKFFTQGEYEDRSIDQTLDLGWKILSILPREELYRIKDEFIEKYLPSTDEHSDEGSSD
ncbi:MAG: V-type ATP synthase subunit B, partial [Treponema sp.]|nr:V-type ATP synthase subunit B [Treponema sp.]